MINIFYVQCVKNIGKVSFGEKLNYFIWLLFIMVGWISTLQANTFSANGLFSKEELAYLTNKKEIVMCVDPDWMPFEKIENNTHIGIASDYFKLFGEIIPIPIKLLKTDSWSQSIDAAKSRKCDIFSLAMETQGRKEYMNFTKSYLSSPLVFITKIDQTFINDPKDVLEYTFGITKGYAFVEILKEKYPKIKLIEYKKLSDGLDAVTKGKVLAYIDNLYTSGYAIQNNYIGELKIGGKFEDRWNFSIGVRNDEPLLLEIFEKTIATAVKDERFAQIPAKWISVKYDQKVDYDIVYKILILLFVVLLFQLYRYFISYKYIKQLKIQKEEFETIFRTSKDGIAIFDLESNFLDFNDAYLKMTGYEREDLLSKSCIELTVPEDKHRSKKVLEDTLSFGYVENYEKSCITKDGGTIMINMSLSLMADKKRIIVSAKNITQNKMLESQAKLASMGEMIGNIAHQWRQPLTVISALASGVSFKQEIGVLKENEIYENMEKIIEQTQYLSSTIDDFRNFIKSGDVKETIDIASLFDKTLSIVAPSLKNHYIDVIVRGDIDIEIMGYKNELIQALINIINNAKDALVENSVVDPKYIFIDASVVDNQCIITIKDNAGGIQLSILDRIFEPYFTTKHQSKGTGLGLAMTHKIVTEMHLGTIFASNVSYIYENKEYTGALFTINLEIVHE